MIQTTVNSCMAKILVFPGFFLTNPLKYYPSVFINSWLYTYNDFNFLINLKYPILEWVRNLRMLYLYVYYVTL